MKRTLLFIVCVLLSLSGYAQTANKWIWINQIAQDGENLWLATNCSGLVKYNKQTGKKTFYTSSNSELCSDDLLSVACRNGKVLVGSINDGVSEFDGNTFTNYNIDNAPFHNGRQLFRGVLYDSDGNLWLGGSGYIYKYDGKTWEEYTQPMSEISSWLDYSALKQSADGTIWFCSEGPNFDGSLGYITKDKEVKTVITSMYDAYDLAMDKQGNVWFNDLYIGVLCYDGNSTKLFNSENSPLPKYEKLRISGLDVDADDNVWFGYNNLLYKYDGTAFTSYQVPTDGVVYDLLIDGNAIWIATGTTGELFRFEDGQFESIDYTTNTQKTEENDDYHPFVEDGKVWKVGTIPAYLDTPVQIVDYYYFDGDTIIDGKTCKKMMCQHFTSPKYPYYENLSQPNYLRYVGAWYEENQKVYFYDERKQTMTLKYDFSLEANDTLQFLNMDGYPPFIIGPKQTGGIKGFKGIYRDVMNQNIRNTTWLEGVGGPDAPFRNAYDPMADRVPEFLMSCVVGDEVIYLFDKYEDEVTPAGARKDRFDFTHTPKKKPKTRVSSEEEPSLYGEYNDQQLDIHLDPLDDTYQVCITDESGKAVYEKAINAGNIVALNIDISAYAKGRYTVTVENSLESFTGEFETLATGIQELKNSKIEELKYIYNLQGQRLSRLQKGLNIVNGRKIYVRN